MIWPKARNTRRIWGLLAVLGLITTCLFSAQVFKYKKIKPEKGYLIRTVPFEKWLKRNYCGPACLAIVSLREGKAEEAEAYALIARALESLDQALRLAPGEKFIRNHYLQVKALQIERARLENIKKKENSNE